jgi:hypothetical protein
MAKVRDLPDCERNGLTVSTVGLFQVFVSDSGRDIAICFATDNLADSQLEALASGLWENLRCSVSYPQRTRS